MTNSIREAMQEALKQQGVEANEGMVLEAPEEETQSQPQETPETTTQDEEASGEKAEQAARDKTGKFAKAPKKDAAQEIPEAQKQEGSTVPEQGTTGGAPATWSKEEQAQWDNVPPLVKNAISRHEKQNQTAVLQAKQELANVQKDYAATSAVLEPYNKMWMQNGIAPQQGLAAAMRMVHEFERNPQGTLLKLAKQYGVNLSEGEESFQDPLMGEVAQLRQQIQSLQSGFQTSQQNQQSNQLNNEVNTFKSTTDAQGNLAYPHFDRVRVAMSRILPGLELDNPNASTQQLMKKAYEVAVYADESLRGEIAASQQAAAEQAAFEKRKADALRARNGVVSLAPAATAVQDNGQRKGMSIRDSLRSALSEGLGRV